MDEAQKDLIWAREMLERERAKAADEMAAHSRGIAAAYQAGDWDANVREGEMYAAARDRFNAVCERIRAFEAQNPPPTGRT